MPGYVYRGTGHDVLEHPRRPAALRPPQQRVTASADLPVPVPLDRRTQRLLRAMPAEEKRAIAGDVLGVLVDLADSAQVSWLEQQRLRLRTCCPRCGALILRLSACDVCQAFKAAGREVELRP